MSTALYPGTFDPVTNGHLDVLKRASKLFDQVIVAVSAGNSGKQTTFELQTRISLVEENINLFENVKVESFDGLLVDYAKRKGANVLVRGLRVISDFEYEFQMAQMNRHLDCDLETIFLMPNEKYFFTSSQLIKQVHLYGERETGLVPENVLRALRSLSENKNPSSFPDEFRRKFTFEEALHLWGSISYHFSRYGWLLGDFPTFSFHARSLSTKGGFVGWRYSYKLC